MSWSGFICNWPTSISLSISSMCMTHNGTPKSMMIHTRIPLPRGVARGGLYMLLKVNLELAKPDPLYNVLVLNVEKHNNVTTQSMMICAYVPLQSCASRRLPAGWECIQRWFVCPGQG